MAGMRDVAYLSNAINGLAKMIQDLGGNWYKAGAELQQFPGQVGELMVQVELWEKEANSRGVSSDPTVIRCLLDAKSSLQDEKHNLERRAKSFGSRWCHRMKMTAFPATLGLSIQAATIACNKIPNTLRLQEEAVDVLERARERMPVSESISNDSRYVPLKTSETEVCHALENSEGPGVILLHGGAGSGKTTFARRMVFHYTVNRKGQFDHVLFLDCGPQAKTEDTQFDIIQSLGYGYKPQANPEDEQRGQKIRIAHRVKGLLDKQKILLVLDDVWVGGFIESIAKLCGSKVKCLITSQVTTLCQSQDYSNFVAIKIQDVSQEDARQMLANHVGLQQIPEHLQVLADKILTYTEFNPLAIASISNVIDDHRAHEREEWEEASVNFSEALKSPIRVAIFGNQYSKSFWLSVEQAIGTLNEDAKGLLVLTSACDGTSVPEEIVQALYKSAKFQCGSGIFSKARNELENRHLIKINSPALDLTSTKNPRKHRTWSVHSLYKLYIEKEMQEFRYDMFKSLADTHIEGARAMENVLEETAMEETTVTTLCALYLNKQLSSKVVSKMGISHDNFNKLKRGAIEPITLLLGRSVSEWWTETARHSVMKVFVSYICNGSLHDEGISYLLGLPATAHATWIAMKDITFIQDSKGEQPCILVDKSTPLLMNALVEQLRSVESDMQAEACQVIINLGRNYQRTKLFLVGWPGLLDGLAESLSQDTHPTLQTCVGSCLINLAYGDDEVATQIVSHEGVLSQLIYSLSKDANPVQERTAWTLLNVIQGVDSTSIVRMRATEGLLESLVRLMMNPAKSDDTQRRAAWAATLLDATHANQQCLDSAPAYRGRGVANAELGMHSKALLDLDKAHQLDPKDGGLLSNRCGLKATMGDFKGAMEDANQAIQSKFGLKNGLYVLQERGVLKRMMGDLHGALADLNEALMLGPNDYESLKHRAYVKFLLKDLEGARADANWTFQIKPPSIDNLSYRRLSATTLGYTSVQFLEYNLK